jgi:prophage antirepressor-like protein
MDAQSVNANANCTFIYNPNAKYAEEDFSKLKIVKLHEVIKTHLNKKIVGYKKLKKVDLVPILLRVHNEKKQSMLILENDSNNSSEQETEEVPASILSTQIKIEKDTEDVIIAPPAVQEPDQKDFAFLTKKEFGESSITVYGTQENPLFRSKEIGQVLGIKDLISTLKSFEEDYKDTILLIDSLGRYRKNTMLTEQGLYKLLFISRVPIAKQFQKWVCNVIKEIRLHGKFEMHNRIEKIENEKIQMEHEKRHWEEEVNRLTLELAKRPKLDKIELNRIRNSEHLLESIYIITSVRYAREYCFKVGRTNDVAKRLSSMNTANITDDQQLYVCDSFACFDASKTELHIHTLLKAFRFVDNREFFVFDYEDLKQIVEL